MTTHKGSGIRPSGYPVLLDLAGRACVVVGGGAVAEHKVLGLLEAGARVTIISLTLTPMLEALAQTGTIAVRKQVYEATVFEGMRPLLVFAATDSPDVNRQIADDARAVGALVDTVDASAKNDFSSMSVIRRGFLIIAFSTSGASPALAARLRAVLEGVVGEEYAVLLDWLAATRPLAKAQMMDEAQRRALWAAILASPILSDLKSGNTGRARAQFDRILNEYGLRGAAE